MSDARYTFQDIDPLLHAPARLGIVTALYANRAGLSFVELRELCELSDGNLSRHLQKLEADKVVRTNKSFVGRLPQTTAIMTISGRARFERYLEQLRTIVEQGVRTANGPLLEDTYEHG
jgi:DNA-binding transcriptional ArsR family regulator